MLVRHFGKAKLLTDIRDNDITKLVAFAAHTHRVIRKKDAKPEDCPLVSARTVNDTTEQLKRCSLALSYGACGSTMNHIGNSTG
jgi:hypothetical protein